MNATGPFRFELSGDPQLRFDGAVHGGCVRFTVYDAGDDTTINAAPFWCDKEVAERLERAVAAFNAEMKRETAE